MSQENVEVVKAAFEAVDRGDLDGMVAALVPEFEYVATGTLVGIHGIYRAAHGFREFLEAFWQEFDDPTIEIRRLIDADGEVVTWVTFRGRGRRSGVDTSLDLWHVWTLREGKVVRGRAYRSYDEALEAVGLRE